MKVAIHIGSLDPLLFQILEIPLPEGYGRILTGKTKKGDQSLRSWRRVDGKLEATWDFPPAGEEVEAHYCIIRPGVESEKPCERCGTEGREKRNRYCYLCRDIILREQRRIRIS